LTSRGCPGEGARYFDLAFGNLLWGVYSVITLSVGSYNLSCDSYKAVDVVQDNLSSTWLNATGGLITASFYCRNLLWSRDVLQEAPPECYGLMPLK
jgi:hypothetical protein